MVGALICVCQIPRVGPVLARTVFNASMLSNVRVGWFWCAFLTNDVLTEYNSVTVLKEQGTFDENKLSQCRSALQCFGSIWHSQHSPDRKLRMDQMKMAGINASMKDVSLESIACHNQKAHTRAWRKYRNMCVGKCLFLLVMTQFWLNLLTSGETNARRYVLGFVTPQIIPVALFLLFMVSFCISRCSGHFSTSKFHHH